MKHSNNPSFSLARRSLITAAFTVLLGTSVAVAQSTSGSGSSGGSSTGGSGSTSSQKSGSSGATYGTGTTPPSSSSSGSSEDSTSRGTSGSTSTSGTTGTSATTGSSSSDTTGVASTMTGRDKSTGKLGFMDRRFVTKAAEASMAELSLAQLAVQQATNPEVKAFAQTLIEDHTKVSSALTAMASQRQVDLDKDEPKQDRTYRSLAKKSGSEFDQEFVEHMIDMHESDVKRFEKAGQDAKDSAVRSFASQHVDHLRQHLQTAQSLRQTIMPTGREESTSGSGSSSTSPSSSGSSLSSPSSGSSSSGTSGTYPSSSGSSSSSTSSDPSSAGAGTSGTSKSSKSSR